MCIEQLLSSRGRETGVSPGAEQHLKPEMDARDTKVGLHTLPAPREPHGP